MILEPIEKLVTAFSALPGIGKKTARRLTYYLLEHDDHVGLGLSEALAEVYGAIDHCNTCGFYKAVDSPCSICDDPRRAPETLCVVSKIQDCIAIDASHSYFGQYHILGGTISPLDGVAPSDLKIPELLSRIEHGQFTELILALDATVDGETTSQYILAHLPEGLKVTRIAAGIPFGAELEYTDKITISRALSMRREYHQ